MKWGKILNILLFVLIVGSLSLPTITNAKEVYEEETISFTNEELKEIEQKEENETYPYQMEFDTEEEAREYALKLENYLESKEKQKGNFLGDHKVTDSAGNSYYYSDKSDFTDYGDFKVYYKNKTVFKFKYKGKWEVNTPYFMVTNTTEFSLSSQLLVFCVEPDKGAEQIDGVGESKNAYLSLTPPQKSKVNRFTAYITNLYDETGNMDYLTAGQLAVWEAVGGTNFSIPSGIKSEWDEIHDEVNSHFKYPSFTTYEDGTNPTPKSYNLSYNASKNRYETTLKDTNGVLDDRYLSDMKGTYGKFHVDGSGSNNLLVWINENDVNGKGTVTSSVVKSTYDPMPSDGQKNNVKYTSKPTFVNSGQDLVAGLSDPITVKVQFTVKEVKGKGAFTKYENDSEVINGDTTNNPLAGAKFGLYKEDGTKIKTLTSDNAGKVDTGDLSLGKYYIQETKAPEGYVLDNTKYYFTIENGKTTNINSGRITNNIIKGNATLTKYENNSEVINGDNINNPLEGAKFEITDLSTGEKVNTVISNTEGEVNTGDLVYGDYKICETSSKVGYVNGGYCEEFSITENNKTVKLNGGEPLVNEIIKGKVHLKKEGIDTNPNNDKLVGLEGTVFEIKDSEGNVIETLTTDKNGVITSSWLEYGKDYQICEKTPTYGYVNSGYCETFDITNNGQIIQLNGGDDLVNQIKYGKVLLNKDGESLVNGEDEVYYPLANAKFGIYWDSNRNGKIDSGEKLVETLTTDQYGYAESKVMKSGEQYIIREDEAPEGWVNAGYSQVFEITKMGQVIPINFGMDVENKAVRGKVEINKVEDDSEVINGDDINNPLEGAKYGIYQKSDDNLIQTITTDRNGYAISGDLKYGAYYLQEIEAPEGYVLDETKYYFSVKENEKTVEVNNGQPLINKVIKGKVNLTKVGETNETTHQCRSLKPNCNDNKLRLSGAEFSIYQDFDKDGRYGKDDLVQVVTTNKSGYAISDYLKYGHYIVVESKAPENYLINDTIFQFDITENGVTVHLNNGVDIIDEAKKKPITIHKEDQYGKPIEGVEFTIHTVDKMSGNLIVDTITTDSNGNATSKDLTYGKYFAEETKAPEDYIMSDDIIKFTIDEYDSEDELTFTIKNELKEGEIRILKVDSEDNDKTLSGAEFGAYNDLNGDGKLQEKEHTSENKIASGVTDENGELVFKNVAYGKYILKEDKAPKGYEYDDSKEVALNIDKDGKIYKVTVANDKIETEEFLKTGNNKKVITFTIIFIVTLIGVTITSLEKITKSIK